MRLVLLAVALLAVSADDHEWQMGVWRDIRVVTTNGGSLSLPIGGTPPQRVGGVTFAGTPPMYFSFPMDDVMEYVTIDGPDGLRYIARWRRRFKGIIINDPVPFAVEGAKLYVRGLKPGQTSKLDVVSTIRLEQ